MGTVVDAPARIPAPGEIAALVDLIRTSGAKAVFGEVQFSPELVETIASEAGVVVESDLYNDSLGDPPVDTLRGPHPLGRGPRGRGPRTAEPTRTMPRP